LTDVALHCGFASSSDFSRSFKQHFGQAPRRFDLDAFRDTRRADFDRLLGAQYVPPQVQVLDNNANPDGFEARVRDLPARTVAYVRVFDPYREGAAEAAFRHLLAWAEQRGLADRQWLSYMWDEPEIVALADCRYDVALVVNEPVSDGDVGCFRFPAMRVAEVDIRGDIHLEVRALDWLYKTWLPLSGYVPDDHPAFEAWVGRPFAHGNGHRVSHDLGSSVDPCGPHPQDRPHRRRHADPALWLRTEPERALPPCLRRWGVTSGLVTRRGIYPQQHPVVLLVEQRMVDAGVALGHRPLHHDRGLRLPHLQHRHAGDLHGL
jgi:DNA gyrase inhibitor GyrI